MFEPTNKSSLPIAKSFPQDSEKPGPSIDPIPVVSVVVGNFNGMKYIRACLESVAKQSFPSIEVIFVDDDSTDGSAAFVAENYPHVNVIRNTREEKGYAACCDVGARAARGEYICFLNPDVELDTCCIEGLVSCMKNSPAIGACGPKLLSLAHRKTLVSAGGFLDIFGFGIDRGIDEEDLGRYDQMQDVHFITGAVILVRATVLWIAGGWDIDTFTYAEDSDLCWRILMMDKRIVFEPTAVAYHFQSPSMGRASPRKIHFMERNRISSMLKNYGLLTLSQVMPGWLVLATGRICYFISCGRCDIVLWTLKAYASSLLRLRQTLKKRAVIQRCRILTDREIVRKFSKSSLELRLLFSGKAKRL